MKKLQSVVVAVFCLTLVLLICGANAAFAQEVTATITGTVTDQSGAAIAGAKVTAKSVERGITYTARSNESGLYRISQLSRRATTSSALKSRVFKLVPILHSPWY